MPVRKIPLRYSSLSGIKNSKSSKGPTTFESSLEADYIELLQFDKNVEYFEEQPYLIEFMHKGKKCTYTPDLLVHFHEYEKKGKIKPLLIEVKYSRDLMKNSEILKPKFDAAKNFSDDLGYEFQIKTEKEIRTSFLNNAKFLNRYKNQYDNVHIPKIDYLLYQVYNLKQTTPKELITACSNIKEQQAIYLYVLWFCIAHDWIICDLLQPLSMNTIIWHYETKKGKI